MHFCRATLYDRPTCLLGLCTLLLVICLQPTQAALTNLAIGNSDFEGTGTGIIDDAVFEASFPQWSTGSNEFEILAQGADGAPTTLSGGAAAGQSLEILGTLSGGQISLIIDIPSNVVAGSQAQFSFDAWSLDNGSNSYFNSGRLRVDDQPGPLPFINNGPATVINTTQSAWTRNTRLFTVNPGDTMYIQWTETVNTSNDFGIRIDDLQLLVEVIPEPGQVGALILAALMFYCTWLRRKPIY